MLGQAHHGIGPAGQCGTMSHAQAQKTHGVSVARVQPPGNAKSQERNVRKDRTFRLSGVALSGTAGQRYAE